jgi:glycosyltransferase A (GT-A) superfamily protein (DUF2064 family)
VIWGARLLRAAAPYPVIFIGADAPDLTARHLVDAAAALRHSKAVIGPAEDGGYWLLGLARPADHLFEDMPWGTERVLPVTLSRLCDKRRDRHAACWRISTVRRT